MVERIESIRLGELKLKNKQMKKVILYIAISQDGFIAKSDGSVDWLDDPTFQMDGEDFGYNDMYNSIDTTLMGYKTFHQVINFDVPFPYTDKTNYVFTRITSREEHEYVEFIASDIVDFTKDLKQKEGKDIWLIGGGQINRVLLENNLIDEMIVTIVPVHMKAGIELFNGYERDVHYTELESKVYSNGFVKKHWILS